MDLRCVKTHLETPFLPTSLDKHKGLETCQNTSQDPLPSSLPLASTRPETRLRPCFISSFLFISTKLKMCLGLCFLFSFFFFLFSFLFTTTRARDASQALLFSFFSFSIILFYWLLFTGLFFQILKLQHPDDMSGTWKGSRCVSSPVCLFFFLQSNFFLLKIIYIEITYGHKHERLHHPYYKDEGLNDTSRCVVWAKSRFFKNSLGFLHTN